MTDTPLTEGQLNEIAARAAAATAGPWTVDLEQCDCSDGPCSHGTYVGAVYANGERRAEFGDIPTEDWQFTIHARTDVPALLALVARLQAERDESAEDVAWLRCLEAAGVDNWDGYDEAIEMREAQR